MDGTFVMNRFLVKCKNIEIGDILFASSIAKKLKEKYPNEDYYLMKEGDYEIQIKKLLDIDFSIILFDNIYLILSLPVSFNFLKIFPLR